MNRKNFIKLCSTTILALQALSFFPAASFADTLGNTADSSTEVPESTTSNEITEGSKETSDPIISNEDSPEDTATNETAENSSGDTATNDTTESSSGNTATNDTTESSSGNTATNDTTESSSGNTATNDTTESSSEDTAINENSGSSIGSYPINENNGNYGNNAILSPNKPNSNDDTYTSNHIEKNSTVEKFILEIGEDARELAQKNDLYASVMIAQAILESGSGTSYLSDSPYYNIFGIKGSFKGHSVTLPTMEDLGNGTLYMIDSEFKAYSNYKDSLEDYVDLIVNGITGNKEFYKNVWKSNTKSYKDATKALTGTYATDIHYDEKLNSLIKTYDLEKYDKEKNETNEKYNFIYPVDNFYISSSFGPRGSEFHRGTDFATSSGTKIHASDKGTVVTASYDPSWGNYVVIKHQNGMSTLYAHQAHYIVKPGQKVEQGDVIGYVGSTGNSTGSHLHFEISLDSNLTIDNLVDPISILEK